MLLGASRSPEKTSETSLSFRNSVFALFENVVNVSSNKNYIILVISTLG